MTHEDFVKLVKNYFIDSELRFKFMNDIIAACFKPLTVILLELNV